MEKKPKEVREEAERRVLSFSEFAYFVAEALRGRTRVKNECEGSVWKTISVNTVRKSNRERRGAVSRRQIEGVGGQLDGNFQR